eukprot:TCALIF_05812-PA protein Name:"Protein of unknown function" AED:0.37 eAED:0.37 QI:0/0.25/0/0.4/0.75/0.8/5/0/439
MSNENLDVNANPRLEPFNARPSSKPVRPSRRNPRLKDDSVLDPLKPQIHRSWATSSILVDHTHAKKSNFSENPLPRSTLLKMQHDSELLGESATKLNLGSPDMSQTELQSMLELEPDVSMQFEQGHGIQSPDMPQTELQSVLELEPDVSMQFEQSHEIQSRDIPQSELQSMIELEPDVKMQSEQGHKPQSQHKLQEHSQPMLESEPKPKTTQYVNGALLIKESDYQPFTGRRCSSFNGNEEPDLNSVMNYNPKLKVSFDKATQTECQNIRNVNESSSLENGLRRKNERKKRLEWLEEKESRLKYYTGFNFREMDVLLEFLGPDIESVKMWQNGSLHPRSGSIPAKAKLYMTLERIRHDFGLVDLGERYEPQDHSRQLPKKTEVPGKNLPNGGFMQANGQASLGPTDAGLLEMADSMVLPKDFYTRGNSIKIADKAMGNM